MSTGARLQGRKSKVEGREPKRRIGYKTRIEFAMTLCQLEAECIERVLGANDAGDGYSELDHILAAAVLKRMIQGFRSAGATLPSIQTPKSK